MAAPITQYFGRVAIDVDQSSLKKVDDYFKALEAKMKRYQGRMGSGLGIKVKVDIDTRATLLNLRRKLDMVGQNLTLTVKRMNFAINGKQIRSQAEKQLSAGIRVKVTPWVTRGNLIDLRKQLSSGLQNLPVTVRYAGNLRQSLISRIGQAFTPSGGGGRRSGGSRSSGGKEKGWTDYVPNPTKGFTGRLLRFGTGAVPFAGGVIGLNTLNQANTDYQSQKIAASGIFAGKVEGGGDAARKQLFDLANLNGLDYKETLPQFNRFMANAMGSMGYGKSFDAFRGFTSFGRARGATAESTNKALYALGQMAGKGKVMSEELFQQMVEASGFGEAGNIFAQAWAQQTKSGKTGAAAYEDLRESMKAGKVKSDPMIALVAALMEQLAAPTLEKARNSADANQMRFRNARYDFNARFSEAGGEAAFSKMWDMLGRVMVNTADKAADLAKGFLTVMGAIEDTLYVLSDLSTTLYSGKSTPTSQAIKDATGIDILKGIHTILSAIGEKLGVAGSILAATGAFGAYKLGKMAVGNKVGDVIDKVTGNTNNLGAYAMPGASALRVWVVNGSGAGFDTGVPTRDGKGGKSPTTPGRKLPGWLSLGFLTQWLALPAAVTGLSMLHPNQNSASVTADPMYMSGAMADMYGAADTFTKKNISAAQPVVEQAAVAATMNHNIVLTADVKIEAGTPEAAIQQFQQQLDSKVFQPFMLQSLQEAQSTISTYAR
jgi:Tape measure protein